MRAPLPAIDILRAPKHGDGSVAEIANVKGAITALGVDACNVYAITKDGVVAYPNP